MFSQNRRGHRLCKFIHFSIRITQSASDIPHHCFCCHGSESNNLSHILAAVFFYNIFKNFIAPCVGEIDIYIRHAYSFGIQKPFKKEPMLNRIQIRNFQRPGNDRTCGRTSPWPHDYSLILCVLHDIMHYQKISVETHFIYNTQLEIQTIQINFINFFLPKSFL